MELSRRDLLKASSRIAAALGLGATGLFRLDEALGLEADQGGLQVVWLQGQSCSGCSVSLINSIYYNTIDDLLLNTLDVNFHSTLMAPAHSLAIAAAEEAYSRGNYVLVIEGAIPAKSNGAYCTLWEGMTMLRAVKRYAFRASHILAVGTCACYGGHRGSGRNGHPVQRQDRDDHEEPAGGCWPAGLPPLHAG